MSSQLLEKLQYSSLPPLEHSHDHEDQPKLLPFFPSYDQSSSSHYDIPSYLSSKTGTSSDQDQDDHHQDDYGDDDNNDYIDDPYCTSEESNKQSLVLRITTPNSKVYSDSTTNSSCDGRSKWMSSKMRLMRKMMNSYPHQKTPPVQPTTSTKSSSIINNSTDSSVNGGCVRVCSDCNTTKTPLWRSGPQGPKSLCNACGIRQRKARKAMAAAVAMEKGNTNETCKIKKVSLGSCNAVIPYKKRYKLEQTRRKIDHQMEDFSSSTTTATTATATTSINLKKKTTSLHPQDEKEAAILLMALSCDLIYG